MHPFILTIALLPVFGAVAFAQGERNRTIDQYACKDVMRDSGANRDVAIAFLHGYLLGKSTGTNFSLDRIQGEARREPHPDPPRALRTSPAQGSAAASAGSPVPGDESSAETRRATRR